MTWRSAGAPVPVQGATGVREAPPTIDRRERPTAEEFFRDYRDRRRPVILTGAIRDWKALSRWTPDFFVSRYGTMDVPIDGRPYNLSQFIREALDSSPQSPAPYLRGKPLKDLFPDLLGDIEPMPEFVFPCWIRSRLLPERLRHMSIPEIFIGGAGGRFPYVHYDMFHLHTFIHQVCGYKEFAFFPPEHARFLYPVDNRSPIEDIDHPDLDRYPLFAQAVPLRGVLGPGETMYVPAGWWHTARMLTFSISVAAQTANSSNWADLKRDVFLRNRTHKPLAAIPVAAYLTGFATMRSAWDRLTGH
jgi:histone arginine demethylase JMJD6